VLHTFKFGEDGIGPYAGVIQDSKGNFYGTSGGGGPSGNGTVFKLSRKGKYTVLYSLKAEPDGSGPTGLIREADGSLYGNTYYGGADSFGTIFELSKTGKETVLYSFSAGDDGAYPQSPLIQDSQGNLYGTTFSYGVSGWGTVFELIRPGKVKILHSFGAGTDGARPRAGVIQDDKGNLYGTTEGGGVHGVGTVFKVSKTGKETVLYSFTGGADGENPYAGVIQDEMGNFYGTTYDGGASNGGTVFKLSKTGKITVLYSFTGSNGDGYNPNAGVIQDGEGSLYGTTYYGGAYGAGTVFKVSKTGKETILYSFTGGADGELPLAGVIQDAKGNLYGTNEYGGDFSCGVENSGCGVVFELTP